MRRAREFSFHIALILTISRSVAINFSNYHIFLYKKKINAWSLCVAFCYLPCYIPLSLPLFLLQLSLFSLPSSAYIQCHGLSQIPQTFGFLLNRVMECECLGQCEAQANSLCKSCVCIVRDPEPWFRRDVDILMRM